MILSTVQDYIDSKTKERTGIWFQMMGSVMINGLKSPNFLQFELWNPKERPRASSNGYSWIDVRRIAAIQIWKTNRWDATVEKILVSVSKQVPIDDVGFYGHSQDTSFECTYQGREITVYLFVQQGEFMDIKKAIETMSKVQAAGVEFELHNIAWLDTAKTECFLVGPLPHVMTEKNFV